MQRGISLGFVLLASIGLFSLGCTKPVEPNKSGGGGDGGHAHSHSAHGPHGGQVMAVGKEEFHLEFVIDKAKDKVTVYLLDKDIKTNKDASSAEETIKITGKAGAETKTFELAAVDRTTGDMPTAQQFELTDPELHGAVETGSATIKITIAGKEFDEKISFEGHGHDHDH